MFSCCYLVVKTQCVFRSNNNQEDLQFTLLLVDIDVVGDLVHLSTVDRWNSTTPANSEAPTCRHEDLRPLDSNAAAVAALSQEGHA